MESCCCVLMGLCLIVWVEGVQLPHLFRLQEGFCYDAPGCGPSSWIGLCRTGKEQSPIDIPITPLLSSPARGNWMEFQMNAHYLQQRKFHVFGQNSGQSVRFELSADLRLCGGGLKACYKFAQLHFHWGRFNNNGSEHTINGTGFPLELHLVHYKEPYNSLLEALASGERDALAVMGILYEISSRDNLELSSFVVPLKNLESPGIPLDFELSLKMSLLYPKDKEFARYQGSLTTPACNQQVIWTVFLSRIQISQYQMDQFRKIEDEHGSPGFNFRPVQPLYGRSVTTFRARPHFNCLLPCSSALPQYPSKTTVTLHMAHIILLLSCLSIY